MHDQTSQLYSSAIRETKRVDRTWLFLDTARQVVFSGSCVRLVTLTHLINVRLNRSDFTFCFFEYLLLSLLIVACF
jgi:hypothetical protein